ncbi:MAG: hypothetical protein IIY05_03640 [Alistipes sp.]|nr:hypothetical protein [Alistipes sp.]
MKLQRLFLATLLLLCVACNTESDIERLNSQALEEYNIPVRPGYEGRNPYWNEFATKFTYAPAFDFKEVEGAEHYLYTVTPKDGNGEESWTMQADKPYLSLTPIWQQIEVGYVTLKVEAMQADKAIATAGERTFFRDFPFKAPYHGAIRGYRESALLALLHIHNMRPMQSWETAQTPDMSYQLNTYPCKIIGSTISLEVLLAKLCPELKDDALLIAENAARFLIAESRAEGDPLAFFPPTYYGNYITSGAARNKGKTMTMEALTAANAFLDLYDLTQKQEYYDRAINITNTYARLQAEDGSLPIKMDFATGEPVNEVKALLHPLLDHLQRLEQQYGVTDYAEMLTKAEQWMQQHTLSSFDMTGQFEDGTVLGLKPYENLTNCTAAPYATYLLGKSDTSKQELSDAIDLIRFSEDQFVFWDTIYKHHGIKIYHTPCVMEQYKYMMPIDHSACNVANAWLSLYEETGDELALMKAKALIDNITILQNANTGMIPTFWRNFFTGEDWINCTLLSIQTLLRMEEIEIE